MKTEIFGTFGPACEEENTLKKMIAAGMTGMRLNLSHTTLLQSAACIHRYQNAARTLGVVPQILIDMKGPELRVGNLKSPIFLEGTICLCSEELYQTKEEKERYLPVPKEVIDILEIGDGILLDDGKILLEVEQVETVEKEGCVRANVVRGGRLCSAKSIKVKDKTVLMPPLTEHDIKNIKFAKSYGVTALMQPFVQSGVELRYVRNQLKEHGAQDIRIFAKIEHRQGVEHLSDILPEADVIIIARGDLGNDMPLWELPGVQKQIEHACKEYGKPYVVVTQMLASMEEHPVPTRAEVSDIYHAVYHGAWGVMLTGETAVGKYPVEAIQYLTNTAREAEHSQTNRITS